MVNNTNLGIYHNDDLDGKCCGSLLLHHYNNIRLYGMNHGDEIPWDLINQSKNVIMCDFSLPDVQDMIKIDGICHRNGGKFTLIDHHKSCLDKLRAHNIMFDGIVEIGNAGCELLWKYLHPNENIPYYIYLIGGYDVWRDSDSAKWLNEILPFQYGIRSRYNEPESDLWNDLLNDKDRSCIYRLIERGEIILDYLEHEYEYVASNSYDIIIDGHKGIAVDSAVHSSMIFNGIYDESVHDLMVVYNHRKGNKWLLSFYTTKDNVDCSKIAVRLGGGGHQKAAGATVDKLPFREDFQDS